MNTPVFPLGGGNDDDINSPRDIARTEWANKGLDTLWLILSFLEDSHNGRGHSNVKTSWQYMQQNLQDVSATISWWQQR